MKILPVLIPLLFSGCTGDKENAAQLSFPLAVKANLKTPESFCWCPATGPSCHHT